MTPPFKIPLSLDQLDARRVELRLQLVQLTGVGAAAAPPAARARRSAGLLLLLLADGRVQVLHVLVQPQVL